MKSSERLLDLLAEATQKGVLKWNDVPGVGHTDSTGAYSNEWVYWYNVEGIAIGRLILVIKCHECVLPLAWGTDGFDAGSRLLISIWSDWRYALNWPGNGHCTMLPFDPKAFETSSIKQTSIAVLSTLLRATKAGVLTWKRNRYEPEFVEANFEGHDVTIKFYSPLDTSEPPIPNLLAKVSIPGATLCFVCGSDGYCLAEEILALADPALKATLNARESAIQAEIAKLEQLIATIE